jgi:hypothetical protein
VLSPGADAAGSLELFQIEDFFCAWFTHRLVAGCWTLVAGPASSN